MGTKKKKSRGKRKQKAINTFIRMLREAGHTQREAKWIAERVFSGR